MEVPMTKNVGTFLFIPCIIEAIFLMACKLLRGDLAVIGGKRHTFCSSVEWYGCRTCNYIVFIYRKTQKYTLYLVCSVL